MIRLEHLTKKIGKRTIFEDFSLEVKRGEMLAIVGKSGSGKTTLLNLLGLIDGDYQGNYYFEKEKNVKVNSSKAQRLIREKISYLFQNFALIENETVVTNLLLALHYRKEKKAQKIARIKQMLQNMQLEATLYQKVSELSGGEQQRIALVRAMLKPSEIILADEPTGSLDPDNREKILQYLVEANQEGKTIVIVTHDPNVAAQCHRVIQLG